MAHASPFPEAPEAHHVESLVLQACDDIDALHVVQRAYTCLEKLILPQGIKDTEELYPGRAELGALVGLVNEEFRRRLDTADAAFQSLYAALKSGSAP